MTHGSSYITIAVHTFSIHVLSILSIHTIYVYIYIPDSDIALTYFLYFCDYVCIVIVLIDIAVLLELETYAIRCNCKSVYATSKL